MFFMNSVTGAIIGFYHVLSIFVFPVLLKYSHPVGLFNKLNLALGAACMLYLHIVRLSHAGKVCSGDYLSAQELATIESDPNHFYYLVVRGSLFYFYLMAFWAISGLFFLGLASVIIAAVRSF